MNTPKWQIPAWLKDAAENITMVTRSAWHGIPQRGRDVITGAAFGFVIGASLAAAWVG